MEYKCLDWDIRTAMSFDDMRNYARAISKNVHMRDYTRDATPEESAMVENIVFGALRAIRFGVDIQSAEETAENIATAMLQSDQGERIDTYETIYSPIDRFVCMVEVQHLIRNVNAGAFETP